DNSSASNAIITVEFRTSDNLVAIAQNVWLAGARKIYKGAKSKMPAIATKLKPVAADLPAVSTLDYAELVARRQKLKELEAQAKAKAAAQAAAKAAAAAKPATPATPGAPAATPAAPGATTGAPAPATATAKPAGTATAPATPAAAKPATTPAATPK